ncbi:MAG: (2Fe-2S)-binding protein [Dehalococcoidales bacterium]|nr:(2Fe-2S)-binding protein [Dehalococcoidales bacterium]MDD5402877.1 (2Fe-2S)-binding protein [Dehalococcoidales bacterium]
MSEEKDIKRESGKISRREFLRDAGIVVGGTAVTSTLLLSACGKEVEVTKTVTDTVTKYVCPVCNEEFDSLSALKAHFESEHPGDGGTTDKPVGQMKKISMTVNGWQEELIVTPTDTLRDALRDKLGLTSIKDMCNGWGACGSCSVIMNGRPILSCMTLAIECDGCTIETAEGVAKSNPDLIDAYIMNYCMQCGYCTPGFVVTAKALLDHNSHPTDEEIRKAFGGNICRCGPYPQHVAAVKAVIK